MTAEKDQNQGIPELMVRWLLSNYQDWEISKKLLPEVINQTFFNSQVEIDFLSSPRTNKLNKLAFFPSTCWLQNSATKVSKVSSKGEKSYENMAYFKF